MLSSHPVFKTIITIIIIIIVVVVVVVAAVVLVVVVVVSCYRPFLPGILLNQE